MNLFEQSKHRYKVERGEETLTITVGSRRSIFHVAFSGIFILLWFYFLGIIGFFWGLFVLSVSIPEVNHSFSPMLIFLVLFLFSMLIFLLVLGFIAVYGITRELVGKEIIEINKDKFVTTLQIFDWKKSKTFAVQKVTNMQVFNKPGIFNLDPFWRKRKRYEEKISFDYDEKTYRFGFWLKEKEAVEILAIIQNMLNEMAS